MNPRTPQSMSGSAERWRSVARGLGWTVALIGGAVLIGWKANLSQLKNVFPGLVSMKPNTALGLLLCGVSLALLSGKRVEKRIRYLVAAAASVATLFAALTLVEYLIGWDFRIDNALFPDVAHAVETSHAGRMSPAAALCFVLSGTALLISSQRRAVRLWQAIVSGLSAAVTGIGALALAGYLVEAGLGYRLWNYTGTAVHTSTGLVLLGCALMALVRSEGGLTWMLDSTSTAVFLAAVVLMIIAGGSAFQFAKQIRETGRWVSHTQEVLKTSQELKTDVACIESGQRGYIITGDNKLYERFGLAKQRVSVSVGDFRRLTADNPNQQHRLDQIEPLIAQRIDFADQTITARNQQGFAAARQLVATGAGTELTDEINLLLQRVQDEEYALLERRENQSQTASVTTFLLLPLGLFLSLTSLSLGVFLLNAGVGEQTRAQNVASDSEARLAGIVNSAMDAIISVDREQHIVLFNAAAEAMFRCTVADAIGQKIDTFIPQRFRDEHQTHVRKFGEAGVTSRSMRSLGTLNGLRFNGEEFPIEASISQVEVASQKIYTVILRDITDRRQAAEAAALLAGIVESSFDAIVSKDLHGIVNSWNPGAERMFGYVAEEMIGRSTAQLAPPDRPEDAEQILARIRRGESVEPFDTVRVRKDGGLIDVSLTVSPIKDARGEIIGASNVARDITERKRSEATLRQSEDQFRTMANSIPQLAWMAHADGFIFWYNQRWYDYTGTTMEQAEGWGWQSVNDPDLLPKILEGWREAIATGQAFEMEVPLRGADGRFRMFLTRVEPVRDSQGGVVQWFGTNTDVDELKRVEESLLDTQAKLKSTLSAGSIGTWTWNLASDRLFADEFTARMFSIEADAAAKGLPVEAYLQVVSEEDRAGVAEALDRAIKSCGHYDIEYRVRQKDGDFRWLQARGRVECDASGNALNFHGAVMDIGERKKAEQALQEAGRFAQYTIDALSAHLCVLDDNGTILATNHAWRRFAEANPPSS